MNKPMMIQDERLEKCKAQLAEAQASVTQLGIALVQERERLAEAQADNAALISAKDAIVEMLNQGFVEDGRKYRRALELACEQISEYALPVGTDDMRRKLIAGRQEIFLNQAERQLPEVSAKILPEPTLDRETELDQLRKVREAAVGNDPCNKGYGRLLQALAQAKGAE